jgi:hypothetical protein
MFSLSSAHAILSDKRRVTVLTVLIKSPVAREILKLDQRIKT